jgi:hypothetical protein
MMMPLDVLQSIKPPTELAERNAQRLAEAKEKLGESWLLHPANKRIRISHSNLNKALK